MQESSAPKKCKLQSAHITERDGKSNLTLVLKGSARAQAEAMRLLEQTTSNSFAERDPETNTVRIVTSLHPDSPLEDASTTLLFIHEVTGCGLSHVRMNSDFDQLGDGKKAIYTPAISIKPVSLSKDPEDISGKLSAKVIAQTHGSQSGYAVHPDSNEQETRLFCVDKSFPTDSECLASAASTIRDIEEKYGIFTPISTGITLVDLRESNLEERHGDLGIATARLSGSDRDLDHALHTLKRRHGKLIAELGRGEDYLDVGTAEKDSIDPTKLLAAVHMSTNCHLPVEVSPIVYRTAKLPHPYVAGIQAQFEGDETGLQKPILRYAAARYAGSFISDEHTVPEAIDPHSPSQVIVKKIHTTPESAEESAHQLAEQLRARLKGEIGKGTDYHR